MIVFLFFLNTNSQFAFNNSKAVAIIFGSFAVLAKMSSTHWAKENLLVAKKKRSFYLSYKMSWGQRR